jgi:uncharacterized protein
MWGADPAPSIVSYLFRWGSLVRALINPHGLWGRLVFEYADLYRLGLSQPIVVEIVEVLRRPGLTRKFRTLQDLDLAAVLAIIARADLVDAAGVRAIGRDPKDDRSLASAALAGAAYLVSEDNDLLPIGEYAGARIINAAAFMRALERQ